MDEPCSLGSFGETATPEKGDETERGRQYIDSMAHKNFGANVGQP